MTGMKRTSLTRFAPLMQEPDPERARDLGEAAFHRDGVVCIPLQAMEDRCGWLAAKQLRQLGEQYFGKRKI